MGEHSTSERATKPARMETILMLKVGDRVQIEARHPVHQKFRGKQGIVKSIHRVPHRGIPEGVYKVVVNVDELVFSREFYASQVKRVL